jgi:hypothetical protein
LSSESFRMILWLGICVNEGDQPIAKLENSTRIPDWWSKSLALCQDDEHLSVASSHVQTANSTRLLRAYAKKGRRTRRRVRRGQKDVRKYTRG